MKDGFSKMMLSSAIVGLGLLMVIGGCGSQSGPDTKKTRLVAGENITLKKQMEQQDLQVQKLNGEIARQKKLLAECDELARGLTKEVESGIEEKINEILVTMVDENSQLRQDNAALKAKVDELAGQLAAIAKSSDVAPTSN